MKIEAGTIIQYKDSFGTHYGIVEKDKGSKVHTFELTKDGSKWVKTFMNRDIPKSDILNKSVNRVQFGKIVGEAKERDYKKEYENYHSKPEQRKNRSERNKARRQKKLEVGDPREVDHKKPLSKGGTNSESNLRVVSRETNRKKGNKMESKINDMIRNIIKEELGRLNEFQEDLKKQMIVLMGLPASGKSTFIENHLTKYFPNIKGFSVTNSDSQVKALQYKYASDHLNKLKSNKIQSEVDFLKFIQGTEYKTNRGQMRKLPISYDELDLVKNMSLKEYFNKYFKGYYATYFDIRDLAKSIEKGLFTTKIHRGSDVVVVDTTGTSIDKIVKRALIGKEGDYNVTIIYLQIDPKLTIARDISREKRSGRGVGESVIMGYASKIDNVYDQYKKIGESGGPVDRLMKFTWKQSGDEVGSGNYSKVEDNRYSLKRKAQALKEK